MAEQDGGRTCYALVNSDWDGYTIYRVYASEADATAAVQRARDYVRDHPRPASPDIDVEIETPEQEAEWASYTKADDAWMDAHPLGRDAAYHGDNFHVMSFPYFDPEPTHAPQPVVDDATVARCCAAYSIALANYGPDLQRRSAHEVGMRAALEAALGRKPA